MIPYAMYSAANIAEPEPAIRTWVSMTKGLSSGLTNGAVYCLATDGAGVWVAGMFAGYAARSTDNGASWSPLTQNLNSGGSSHIHSIATDRAGTWIAGMRNGYNAISTDNGVTWSPLLRGLNSGFNVATYALATNRSGTWIAGMQNGYAARSTNNGVTWSAIPKFAHPDSPGIDIDYTALATDFSGVWVRCNKSYASRSADNGVTWSHLTPLLNSTAPGGQLAALATDGAGVWVAGVADTLDFKGYASRSTDNGITWTSLPRGLNSGEVNKSILTLATNGIGEWNAGMENGRSAYSSDNGANWVYQIQGLNSGSVTQPIFSLAAGSDRVWAAGLGDGRAARLIVTGGA